MGQYLLIESRNPFASGDVESLYVLAGGLAKVGNKSVSPRHAPARGAERRAGQPQGGDER